LRPKKLEPKITFQFFRSFYQINYIPTRRGMTGLQNLDDFIDFSNNYILDDFMDFEKTISEIR
jgi:hypothetical protein